MDILIENFDVISYLEDKGIKYWKGPRKNISRNWVGITCPWCDDPSNHLGINLEGKTINCWRCGKRGSIMKLLLKLERSYDYAIRALMKYQNTFEIRLEPIKKIKEIKLPGNDNFTKMHINFLLKRGLNPDFVIDYYRLKACGPVGKYKFRIIIPVFIGGKLVTFTSRDVTGKRTKYMHCPSSESIIPIKSTLYNLDRVKDTAVLVEGVFDVFRLGDGSIASFGTEVTKNQISLLLRKEVKSIFIIFDSDAIDKARKVADTLSGLFDHIEVIKLEKGDPANLKEEEAKILMKEILGGHR